MYFIEIRKRKFIIIKRIRAFFFAPVLHLHPRPNNGWKENRPRQKVAANKKKKTNDATLRRCIMRACRIIDTWPSAFYLVFFFHLSTMDISFSWNGNSLLPMLILLLKYHANKRRNAKMFNTILPSAWAIQHTCTQQGKHAEQVRTNRKMPRYFMARYAEVVKLVLDWFQAYFCYSFKNLIDLEHSFSSVNGREAKLMSVLLFSSQMSYYQLKCSKWKRNKLKTIVNCIIKCSK